MKEGTGIIKANECVLALFKMREKILTAIFFSSFFDMYSEFI